MKFLDPESRLYCAAGKYTSLRGSLHSLWIGGGGGEKAAETAIYPRAATAYIVLSSEEASERRLLRVFEREDESTGGKRWFVSFATTTPSSLAVTHYLPGGDILFDEENVRV